MAMAHRVLMGLQFFPRGGSAHVANNLARALPASGWEVRVVSGSGEPPGDAEGFYAGLDVVAVDMTPAMHAADPMAGDPPMHPSFEERDDAPDRVFASLDDHAYEHQVDAWSRILSDAGAAEHDILHLHHLTPLNAAAERVAPGVPVVGHLHGTELLMLEEDPDRWPYLEAWAERMRAWAQRCERLIVLSRSHVERAEELLGIDPERCVVVSNGFDPEIFDVRHVDRLTFWHEHLVTDPRGWAPGEGPGSVRYTDADLRGFAADGPVLLYVGRFTGVKRLPLLVEAYALAQPGFARPAPLVILGGYPGEWEGEHPLDAIRRIGATDVFLPGWHSHTELSEFLNASDVIVLPSVREQFGQVLVEGMACGLPAIAVDAHGPAEIVDPGRTGWLVEADDVDGLAQVMLDAVNEPGERARRGREAYEDARARFAWPALAEEVAEVYEAARSADLAAA
jgi:glycosyltransferase involved in cell wall biosynthesis